MHRRRGNGDVPCATIILHKADQTPNVRQSDSVELQAVQSAVPGGKSTEDELFGNGLDLPNRPPLAFQITQQFDLLRKRVLLAS